MSSYEVVFTLFSIVYGLLLADVFRSLHRLLRARERVQWHWLPLLAAWYFVTVVLKNWWGMASDDTTYWGNAYVFLVYCHLLLLLYLLVSAVLPDDVPAEGVDLRAYYFETHRYLWGLMTATVTLAAVLQVVHARMAGASWSVGQSVVQGVIVLLFASLAWSRRYAWHAVLLPLFTVEALLEMLGR